MFGRATIRLDIGPHSSFQFEIPGLSLAAYSLVNFGIEKLSVNICQ